MPEPTDLNGGRLSPARALLSPLFLGALVTLALNDHVLKGAGVLPGWLTGKLSDVAGLVVLPVVLAVVFRVRRTSGFVAAQLVSVAFLAGLKLSVEFSHAWTTVLGLFGLNARNTVDPTDLFAVVVLVPLWRWVLPVMRKSGEGRGPSTWRPSLELVVLCTSAVFLVATSQAECQNFTKTTSVVPNDTAPKYPGPATGTELLARSGPTRTGSSTGRLYSPTRCVETSARAVTDVTVTYDTARAVTRHDTIDVDWTKKVEGCHQMPQGTTITVDVPVSIRTADGAVSIDDTVTLHEPWPDAGVSWSFGYWRDQNPAQLKDVLDRAGITSSSSFVGAKIRWTEHIGGEIALVREKTSENCALVSWPDLP